MMYVFIPFFPVINGDMTIVDVKEFEYGGDIFFEITHPPELQYTYRIRPAKSFGIPFVNNYILLLSQYFGFRQIKLI